MLDPWRSDLDQNSAFSQRSHLHNLNVLQMSWLLRRKTVSTCLHLKWQLCSASKNARQSIIESCTAEVPDPGVWRASGPPPAALTLKATPSHPWH